jgi:hypothetical protein
MNKRLSSNQDDFRRELRQKFFRIVEQQVSSFLPDLAGEPYQKILLADIHEDEFWGRPQENLIDLLRERTTPAVDAFADALIGWACKYHIKTDWVMRDAFQLLSRWKDGGSPTGEDTRGFIHVRDSLAYDRPIFQFEFIAPGLYAGIDLILKEMDRAYQERRERFKEGLLWQAKVRKAEAEATVTECHLVWLALYQCGSDSTFVNIAKEAKATAKTVSGKVHEVAAYLGLSLKHPNKGGRKKGIKEERPRNSPKNK